MLLFTHLINPATVGFSRKPNHQQTTRESDRTPFFAGHGKSRTAKKPLDNVKSPCYDPQRKEGTTQTMTFNRSKSTNVLREIFTRLFMTHCPLLISLFNNTLKIFRNRFFFSKKYPGTFRKLKGIGKVIFLKVSYNFRHITISTVFKGIFFLLKQWFAKNESRFISSYNFFPRIIYIIILYKLQENRSNAVSILIPLRVF